MAEETAVLELPGRKGKEGPSFRDKLEVWFKENHPGFVSEAFIVTHTIIFEAVRGFLVGLKKSDFLKNASGGTLTLDEVPKDLALLQNLGDYPDGFTVALITYSLLALTAKEKVTESAKLAAAFVVGSAVVAAHETGLMGNIVPGTPDIADIPAGIIGSAIYVGVHQLVKGFVNKADQEIDALEKEVTVEEKVVN